MRKQALLARQRRQLASTTVSLSPSMPSIGEVPALNMTSHLASRPSLMISIPDTDSDSEGEEKRSVESSDHANLQAPPVPVSRILALGDDRQERARRYLQRVQTSATEVADTLTAATPSSHCFTDSSSLGPLDSLKVAALTSVFGEERMRSPELRAVPQDVTLRLGVRLIEALDGANEARIAKERKKDDASAVVITTRPLRLRDRAPGSPTPSLTQGTFRRLVHAITAPVQAEQRVSIQRPPARLAKHAHVSTRTIDFGDRSDTPPLDVRRLTRDDSRVRSRSRNKGGSPQHGGARRILLRSPSPHDYDPAPQERARRVKQSKKRGAHSNKPHTRRGRGDDVTSSLNALL